MVFSSLSREGKIGRWLTPQFLFTSGSIACSTFTVRLCTHSTPGPYKGSFAPLNSTALTL